MKKHKYQWLLIISIIAASLNLYDVFKYFGYDPSLSPHYLSKFLWYFPWILFPAIYLFIRYGYKNIIDELGLGKYQIHGLGLGFLATVPMLIGYALIYDMNMDISIREVIYYSLLPAIMEELIFRSFLYGQLFYRSHWGFIPSSLAASLIFGIIHFYQGTDISSGIGIVLLTAVGGMIYSWLYSSWNKNIYVPIGLHFFGNFYWALFHVSDTGNLSGLTLYPFILMAGSYLLFIYFTYKRSKRKGWEDVNKRSLFKNHTMSNFKKGAIFLAILVSINSSAKSQSLIKGVVFDKETNENLAFVNIGFPLKNKGTVSNQDGYFTLPISKETAGDTLLFSMVGYKKEKLIIDKNCIQDSLRIALVPEVMKLSEVIISKKKTKLKKTGSQTTSSLLVAGFLNNKDLGSEIGVRFRVHGKTLHLKRLNFYIARQYGESDSVSLRLKFYRLISNNDFEEIPIGNIIFKIPLTVGWKNVDLDEYNISRDEDFLATLEWLGFEGKKTKATIKFSSAPPYIGKLYFRLGGSQGTWGIYKGGPVGLYFDAFSL